MDPYLRCLKAGFSNPAMHICGIIVNFAPLMQAKERREGRTLRACKNPLTLWEMRQLGGLGHHLRGDLQKRGCSRGEERDGGENEGGHGQKRRAKGGHGGGSEKR